MEIKQLRIGNYVDLSEGFSVHNDILTVSIKNIGWYNEFKPIPLTEEWLIKFGFEILNKNAIYNYLLLYWNIKDEEYDFVREGKATTIKYIHQLQNLYFALTEEELTIK